MVNNSYISGGGPGVFQNLLRGAFAILAAIGGFFVFAASAVFALIVVGGLLLIGLVTFTGLWLRAKIMGKPMVPGFGMYRYRKYRARQETGASDTGPVIDAYKTPDGWSVDRD